MGGQAARERTPLTPHVPWAAPSVEQTLRPVILGPTSILLSWNAVPEARGYRLEWRRESGQCRGDSGQAGLGLGFSRPDPDPVVAQAWRCLRRWCCPHM